MENVTADEFLAMIKRGNEHALLKWCEHCERFFSTVAAAKRHARARHPSHSVRELSDHPVLTIRFFRNALSGKFTYKVDLH